MNERTVIFKQGEENGIVIEREKFESSIFLNQYQQAINIFQRLWTKQKGILLSDNRSSYRIDNQFSNIIAFCGDRGEGKTSCMSSFATILTDDSTRAQAQTTLLLPDKMIACKQVEWLDTIDPSFFDTKHNVLELLLGRMYAKVEMDCTSTQYEDKTSKIYLRRCLMEHFQQVKKDISVLEKNEKNYDSLEEISDLAAGVRLKEDLQKLFKHYLDYQGKECLLICIDDLDLNITEGYKMAEMLRKYLICPQCIILVAVKVDQLIDVIATAHQKEVKDTELKWSQCQQMAQKYVTKLFPRDNRVTMPIPADICEFNLKIADIDETNDKIGIKDITVKERVVQLIFQKTGYVFYNAQHLSPIIPKNLRELRHLLSSLEALPDAKDNQGNDNETGRNVFKDYFFGTWIVNLSKEDYNFSQQLAQYDNLTTLNAFVVEYFSNRIKEANIEIKPQIDTHIANNDDSEAFMEDYAPLYLDITNRINTSANISVGDVMYVLWLVSIITVKEDIQNLIFFIKTIYSMRLYACYNEITSEKDATLFPEIDYTKSYISIHRADRMYDCVNRLQRLVNGSYFSYPAGSLLSKKHDHFVIDFSEIRKLFKKLSKTDENDAEYVQLLNICEYFALTITYASTKENIEKANFSRTAKTPTFLGVFSNTANYAIFDFLHPFYALTNIKYAYHRFDEILCDELNEYREDDPTQQNKLYDIAQANEKSILSLLKGIRRSEYTDNWDMHGCISDAIIRVIDIQWAIYEELLRQYRTHRVGSIKEKIYRAYDDIQKLNITLYPKICIKDNKVVSTSKAHHVEFEFIYILCDFIKNNTLISQLEDWLIIDDSKRMNNQFLTQLLLKLQRPRLRWPKTGHSICSLILQSSDLNTTYQRTKFNMALMGLFDTNKSYTYDEVTQKANEIALIYFALKRNK